MDLSAIESFLDRRGDERASEEFKIGTQCSSNPLFEEVGQLLCRRQNLIAFSIEGVQLHGGELFQSGTVDAGISNPAQAPCRWEFGSAIRPVSYLLARLLK